MTMMRAGWQRCGTPIQLALLGLWLALALIAAPATQAADDPGASAADTDEPAAASAAPESASAATTRPVTPGGELATLSGPLLRMVLSLLAVLAVLAVCAWLARRVRGTQLQGGLIQIVSGLSLGPKEKVVLLRVGEDQVLVGLSPAGMQPLHVVGKAASAQPFSLSLADAAVGAGSGVDGAREQAS